MSRSSASTSREQPITQKTSVTGTMLVRAETFTIPTAAKLQIVDLTDRITEIVERLGVAEGLLNLCSLHTTCTVFVNEFQPALQSDMKAFLQHIVDGNASWLHNDPAHSDCDRANADAHLRAMVVGQTVTLQVSGGEVVLGQWQRILMAELDGPRTRTFRLQVLGCATV